MRTGSSSLLNLDNKFSMPKFAQGNNSKKKKNFCQLTMFEAASCNNFRVILIISFQCPNLQRAITKKNFFFIFSPGYLIIIFYQLTKLEATSCNSF